MLLEDHAGELRFHGARNSLASPTRYAVHPEDLVAAYRTADALGGRVVVAVHSHPEGPRGPSARDRREWLTPELAMFIVSFEGGEARLSAYQVEEGGGMVNPWPIE
jgi:proteasome lid subunit RPN8/RPN11